MSEWPEHCFKAYDIRGLSGTDLTKEFALRLGKAFATYIPSQKIAVGRDIRDSSPGLASGLMEGLASAGVEVLDLGIVSTGALYHACWTLPVDGGIMVTASHLPMPTHNGFKMCRGTLPLAGEEIQELKQVFLDGEFKTGDGKITDTPHIENYLEAIIESTGDLSSEVSVGIDCGNAVPGPFLTKLFDKMGVNYSALYCDWDASEPNHGADPTRPYNMVDLGDLVKSQGLDFGIGCDGDGDRVGAVDENGEFVYPDRLITLFAEDLLSNVSDDSSEEARTIVYDVKCSMNVEVAIRNAGGVPVMSRTGHSFMKRVLAEKPECMFASEMSGHFFPADRGWYGFDCSLYNAARLVELWSRKKAENSEISMSEELNRLAPNLPTTGECKVPCAEENKLAVVDSITIEFKDFEASNVDGVRVKFHVDGEYVGWYLARKSNTEPVLVMRAEANSEENLKMIRMEIEDRVSKHIDISKLLEAF